MKKNTFIINKWPNGLFWIKVLAEWPLTEDLLFEWFLSWDYTVHFVKSFSI